jgi:SAM-dependent methyltransferase
MGRGIRSAVYRLRRALQRYGVWGTIAKCARIAAATPRTLRARRRDRTFDARYAIDTAGIVHLHELDVTGANVRYGVRYEPTNPEWFRDLIGWLPIDYRDFVFVDFGAGKGRALVLASEFPFKRIVGVEFSSTLAEIARRNVERLSERADFEVRCTDAVDYELPDEPCVLYFYNPFASPVLQKVLANIRRSLERMPRHLFIVVTGDAPLGTIVESGFEPLESEDDAELARRVFVPTF